jgi:Luciferase-like monooxygenase
MKVGLFVNTQFPEGFNLVERIPEMVAQIARGALVPAALARSSDADAPDHACHALRRDPRAGHDDRVEYPDLAAAQFRACLRGSRHARCVDRRQLHPWPWLGLPATGVRSAPANSERAPRFNESIALMRRLWTEERVSHKGRFYAVDNAGIGVKPVGPPLPITVECCVGARHSTAHAECRGPLEYKYNAYASWGLQSRTTQGSFEDFARPVHHRRQALGERRNRTISRASGRRSFYHALPVTRTAAGASAELDPAAWRYFRGVGSVGALVTWPAFQVSAARPR